MVKNRSPRIFKINDRIIGDDYPPFVIAEIGINHEGSMEKALKMVEQAAAAGCECAYSGLQRGVSEDQHL